MLARTTTRLVGCDRAHPVADQSPNGGSAGHAPGYALRVATCWPILRTRKADLMSPIPWTTVPAAIEINNAVIDPCSEVATHSPIASSARPAINGAHHPRSRLEAMAVTTPRIPQMT